MAAVLAVGDGRGAEPPRRGGALGPPPPASGAIHVTIGARVGRDRRPGIAIHRSTLAPAAAHDHARRNPGHLRRPDAPRPRRGRSPRRTLERATDEAERLRVFDLARAARSDRRRQRQGRDRPPHCPTQRAPRRLDPHPQRSRGAVPRPVPPRPDSPQPARERLDRPAEGDGYEADFLWPDAPSDRRDRRLGLPRHKTARSSTTVVATGGFGSPATRSCASPGDEVTERAGRGRNASYARTSTLTARRRPLGGHLDRPPEGLGGVVARPGPGRARRRCG